MFVLQQSIQTDKNDKLVLSVFCLEASNRILLENWIFFQQNPIDTKTRHKWNERSGPKARNTERKRDISNRHWCQRRNSSWWKRKCQFVFCWFVFVAHWPYLYAWLFCHSKIHLLHLNESGIEVLPRRTTTIRVSKRKLSSKDFWIIECVYCSIFLLMWMCRIIYRWQWRRWWPEGDVDVAAADAVAVTQLIHFGGSHSETIQSNSIMQKWGATHAININELLIIQSPQVDFNLFEIATIFIPYNLSHFSLSSSSS